MILKISSADYELALARGRQKLEEPHAVSARYVSRPRALELVYSNGLTLRIDPKEVPALRDLPASAFVNLYVTPGGDGLVFGEDGQYAISIPGLVARFIPVDLARRAVASARGRVRSELKADAARRNGAKGGRPAKTRVPVDA